MRKRIRVVSLLLIAAIAGLVLRPGVLPQAHGDDAQPPQPPPRIIRVYDIRDFLMQPGEFPLTGPSKPSQAFADYEEPDFSLNSTSNNVSQNPAIAALTIPDREPPRIERLLALIEDTVAPDTWVNAGGCDARCEILQGKLYVLQTPDAQRQIAKLLGQVLADANKPVHIRASWLQLTDEQVADLHAAAPPGAAKSAVEIDPAILQKQKIAPFARGELRCTAGQTVHIAADNGRVELQIQPTIAIASRMAMADVLARVSEADGQAGQELHTTACIPLGQDVIVGAAGSASANDPSHGQLYLALRIDAL